MPKYWVKNYFTHGRFPEDGLGDVVEWDDGSHLVADTNPEKVLKTKWKKQEGIWVKKTVEEGKEALAKGKEEDEVNMKPKKILNVDLMKFKFVRNVVKNVESSDRAKDKSEILGKKIERKKTGRKETKETPVKKTPLKKVKAPRKDMKSRDTTTVNTPECVKSNGGRASGNKRKGNTKINLIKNYFSPVNTRELSLPTDKLLKLDNFSTKFTVIQGQVLPLSLNQNKAKVCIHNQDQTGTAPENQPIAAHRMPEDIVMTNEKPEMTFKKTDQDVLQNKPGGHME